MNDSAIDLRQDMDAPMHRSPIFSCPAIVSNATADQFPHIRIDGDRAIGKHLPDRIRAFDTKDAQHRALHACSACTGQTVTAASVPDAAYAFALLRMHVAYLPAMAYQAIR